MLLIRTGASRTVRNEYVVEIEFYIDSEHEPVIMKSSHILNKYALEKVERIIKWCKSVGIEYEIDVL